MSQKLLAVHGGKVKVDNLAQGKPSGTGTGTETATVADLMGTEIKIVLIIHDSDEH